MQPILKLDLNYPSQAFHIGSNLADIANIGSIIVISFRVITFIIDVALLISDFADLGDLGV